MSRIALPATGTLVLPQLHFPKRIGSDGLTRSERKERAAAYREREGSLPTAEDYAVLDRWVARRIDG